MDRMILKKKAIAYMTVSIAVLVMLLVWPLKMIRFGYTAKSDEIMARESDPISVEYNMAQMFEGIGGNLKSVDLLVCNDMAGQVMTFRMYDENHEQVFERFLSIPEEFVAPDFVNIPVRFDMEEGKEYSFIVEGLTCDLYCAYEDRNTTTSPVNYFMAYGGAEVPEYDLIVRYNYAKPFVIWQIILTLAALTGICAIVIYAAARLCKDDRIVFRKLLKYPVYPLLAVIAVLSLYLIMFKRIFGPDTKNNAFLTLGVFMLLFIVFFAVTFARFDLSKDLKPVFSVNKILHCIRIISMATVLWYCYEYMNGLYDIYHYYSISKLVIAFAFLLISTFEKKELLNIVNAVWLIAGPILGYLYYLPQKGVEEQGELYRLNGIVIAVGGFVIINLIYSLIRVIRKEVVLPRIRKAFAIPFTVFATGICILANGRYWVYLLVVLCLLLIHRLAFMRDRERFTSELCAGIILNFYMMVYFSLRHRPYYFYQYYRYNMGYHTVTVTAYYLAMIVCASWMRLYEGMRRSPLIRDNLAKLFTFGMSVTYLIFTMSRTGFLSVGAMFVFALVMVIISEKKDSSRRVLKYAVMMMVAVIYMFPVTFFLTDVVPRISNDPVVFEYEVRDFTFKKGMPYADANYMTIEQFVSEFGKKVFGLKEKEESAGIILRDPFAIRAYAQEADEETEEYTSDEDVDEDVTDMSNGRFDIFKSYISVWNLWGHEEMGTELPNGEIAVHAHNSFLQVAHDHGIIFGVYFVLFIAYVILLSMIRALRAKEDIYALFCPIILVCFVMASLVEWLMHPCNPFGLTIFMAMMPLFYKGLDNEKSN